MTASQAILSIGEEMFKGFSIEAEPCFSIYKQVYQKFTNGLDDKNEKGVLVIGGVGVGKSAMMKIFQRLFKDTSRRFRWVSASEFKFLLEEYDASQLLEMYGRKLNCDLYIDDIGLNATEFKKYGNSVNIISEIIYERYDLFVETGIKTHFSSNQPTKVDKKQYPNVTTLSDIYGERMVDRLRQMCDTIVWKGESLRK